MTEQEAIERLKLDMEMITFDPDTGEHIPLEALKNRNEDNYKAYIADEVAIKALEEIQQYRAIGTPEKIAEELNRLRNDNECQGLYFTLEERQDLARQHRELEEYQAIGTQEECREAVDKQKKVKEAFEKWKNDTSGIYAADDETTHLICALKQILRSDED